MNPQIADRVAPPSAAASGTTLFMARRALPIYPPEESLLHWLGLAARHLREEAGVSMVEVAALLGMNTTKGVERFERAENWPLSLEWTLAAYGLAIGIDSRDLMALAMRWWFDRGRAPTLTPNQGERAARTAAQKALEAEARKAAGRAQSSGTAKRARGKAAGRKKQRGG